MSISIIIVNFNYGRYIRQAIESALAVVAPRKQVIIVDDGSTDNSRKIIKDYADKTQIILKSNEGQFSAYNEGFYASTGKWVLFLDSDDFLSPGLFKNLFRFMTPSVSKIQYQSYVVDHLGRISNKIVPAFNFSINPKKILNWNLKTGAYPSSWGSGNIYSSSFLRNIFPLKGDLTKTGDTYLVALAPFFGKIETCKLPLAYYRIHGKNFLASDGSSIKKRLESYQLLEKRFLFRMAFAKKNNIILPNFFPKRNLTLVYENMLMKKLFPKVSTCFSCNYYDLLMCLFVDQPVPLKKEWFYFFVSFLLFFCNRLFVKKYLWFFWK